VQKLRSLLNYLDEQKKYLAPTFAFIDPFGYSDTPFLLIDQIMENPKCEVLVTFMYAFIKRALGKFDQVRHLDTLFGTQEWRKTRDINDPLRKKEFLQQLYNIVDPKIRTIC